MSMSEKLGRDAVKLLKSISQSTESKFTGIGNELTKAISLLEKITADFDALSANLESETIASATRDLSAAATRVAELGNSMALQRATHGRLQRSIPTIGADLSRIQRTINVVGILAMNGKIAAAGINAAGGDFSSSDFLVFAKEVDRLVKLAQGSIGAFQVDLTQLKQELNQAGQGYAQFEKQQAEAVSSIPKWLGQSVETAAKQGRDAAAVSQTVRERFAQVHRCVGEAIMALQIGDITRQRIEHVEHALDFLDALARGKSGLGNADGAWWQSLSATEQQMANAEILRLQSAQLSQTAAEFEREVERIITALKGMTNDTGDILRLSSEAFGAADHESESWLDKLEGNVDRALGLLRRFKAAQDESEAMAQSVRTAVERSARHLATVRSLEIDLRLLGLNMTFRCDRLGDSGQALSVVAQELRACADQTTEDAGAVMTGLEQVTAIAGEFSNAETQAAVTDFGTTEGIMTASVRTFHNASQSIADTLAMLRHDGQAVAMVLEAAATTAITFHAEAARTLRKLSAELLAVANGTEGSPDAAFKERALSLIGKRYTMASERTLHDRLSADSASSNATSGRSPRPATGTATLEDILF